MYKGRVLFCFVLVVLLCTVAVADEAEDKGKSGVFDIILKPAELLLAPVTDLGEIVVTPGRTRQYVYNVNRNISVIDAEEIKRDDPRYIQQILEQQPGIVVSGFFGNAKDNSVDMRGFGETGNRNYLVLIDGRRSNQIDMSGADLSQIDPDSIKRIEIIRGANSVLYGDNAAGGVINIITKTGEKGDHFNYTQRLGSYHYDKEYFSVEGGHEFLDYFFNYSYQDSEGYRINNDYEANDIFASITMRPSEYLDARFTTGFHRDWYGQPGALFDGNMQSDSRRGSRFPDSKAKTEDYFFTFDPRVSGSVGDHEAALSGFFSFRKRRATSRDVGWNVYETNHHIFTWEFRPKCEVNSLFFDERLENRLVVGADYFRARDRILSGDVAFRKSQVDIVKETFGIYALDDMILDDKFILNGGIRGEWAVYDFDQKQPAVVIDSYSPRETAVEVGAGYKYNETSQVYANYSRSFRYPTTDEYFQSAYETFDWWTFAIRVFPATLNTNLKHQVGNNYEVGIKDNTFDMVRLNMAYYFIDNENEIYYDPTSFRNENYDHTFHHGLELEARADIFEKVEGFFNYNYQRSFFVGGQYDGYQFPLVPEHKISGGFNVHPFEMEALKGLDFGFAVNYMGSRYIASDPKHDSSPLKSHVTVDLGLSYTYKCIRVFATLRNCLREKYNMNATRNWLGNTAFYPAPDRTFEGGVSVSF